MDCRSAFSVQRSQPLLGYTRRAHTTRFHAHRATIYGNPRSHHSITSRQVGSCWSHGTTLPH